MKFCYVMHKEDCFSMLSEGIYSGGMGINPSNKVTQDLLDSIEKSGFFADRNHMEVRPTYKQIIPVFTLHDPKKESIVLYRRRSAHTEQRLAGKWTCAFGGHIDPNDFEKGSSFVPDDELEDINGFVIPYIVSNGITRECKEECGIEIDQDMFMLRGSFNGFIFDNSDDVGRVHLGLSFTILHEINPELLDKINRKPEIDKVIEVYIKDIPDLLENKEFVLEGWARILLSKLMNKEIVKE